MIFRWCYWLKMNLSVALLRQKRPKKTWTSQCWDLLKEAFDIPDDSQRVPEEFPKNSQRICKEFPKNFQRVPKEFPKNPQRIPKEFPGFWEYHSCKFSYIALHLTPNSPLVHTYLTYPKLNMEGFSVPNTFLGYGESTQEI